ncbi:MAG TPA: outer membrane beta-barrel protein [Candidatus Angelobacter sp.]|nr:outer membrane beta-barrel protein [Candidatus Angelobacter sp.]
MCFGKHKGYFVYPVLALAILIAFPLAHAQDALPQQQTESPTEIQSQAQSQTQTSRERVEVLRRARERVRARREARIRQTIRDTYSHQYELYFGGGYLRFRPGHSLQKNTEADWNVGITDYFHGRLGATADFRGYYGTTFTNVNEFQVFAPSISQYTFMAGPTYRFFEGEHWGWNAYVLAGIGHGNFGTGTGGLPPELIGLYKDQNAFNATPGVSVDYNLGPGLAFRLSSTYLYSRYGGDNQNNLGFNLGVVYRFGRQK